jgi:hypothetical protein
MAKIKKAKKSKSIKKEIGTAQAQPQLISVVLLCDLPGHRMKSYGPTSLVNVNDKYLIDIQIDAIKKTFANNEIIICVGFDAEKVSKHIRSKYRQSNIRIVENQIFHLCNSCEGIRLAINNTLNDKVLIVDGNLLVSKKTLCDVDLDASCVFVEKYPSDNLEIGINVNEQNKAQHFSFGAYKTWSEILFLHGMDQIEHIRKFLNHQDSKKKFMFEAINDLLKNKYDIHCIENKHPVHKINNIKTYHYLKENHEIFNI